MLFVAVVVVGCWLCTVYGSVYMLFVVACCSLRVEHCVLFVVRCGLFCCVLYRCLLCWLFLHCSLSVVGCVLCVACCVLVIVAGCCVVIVVCWLLFVVWCLLWAIVNYS